MPRMLLEPLVHEEFQLDTRKEQLGTGVFTHCPIRLQTCVFQRGMNMPVSSGKGIVVMTEPWQDFPIGELFRYSPLSEPGVEMVLCAEYIPDNQGGTMCKNECRIRKYCEQAIYDNDSEWVPTCSRFRRCDEKSVCFKEV